MSVQAVPSQTNSAAFAVHFLASGSSGNCTLIRQGDDAFIIDFGLGPEALVRLLRSHGIKLEYWRDRVTLRNTKATSTSNQPPVKLAGAVLTHLHGDHFSKNSVRLLEHNEIPLWLHASHLPELEELGCFERMRKKGLVQTYGNPEFRMGRNLRATALRVPHDSVPTSGFVFEAGGEMPARFSYFADLGHFPPALAEACADSDVLALEFNHDVAMERASGRHPRHVARVLGPHGHLSNEQAAQALRLVLSKSRRNTLKHLALLHISRDCNRAELAEQTAAHVLAEHDSGARMIVTRHREYAGSAVLEREGADLFDTVAGAPTGAVPAVSM